MSPIKQVFISGPDFFSVKLAFWKMMEYYTESIEGWRLKIAVN